VLIDYTWFGGIPCSDPRIQPTATGWKAADKLIKVVATVSG
jgi:hypothetical protein